MSEIVYLVRCKSCKKLQQITSKNKFAKGSKTCIYCNKEFKLNNETIVKRVK